MNNTKLSIEKEITNDFALSDLLADLIKANVDAVAQEVVSKYPHDSQYLDSAKVGCYEAWVLRLAGMLEKKELHYLLNLLQMHVDKVEWRD